MDISGAGRSSSSSGNAGFSKSNNDNNSNDNTSPLSSAISNDSSLTSPAQNDADKSPITPSDGFSIGPTTSEMLSRQETRLDRARGDYPAPDVSTALGNVFDSTQDATDNDVNVGSAVAGAIGGNNGIFSSPEIRTLDASADFNQQVIDDGLGNKAKVSAVVLDNVTGQISTGINTKTPLDRSTAHPVIQQRLDNMDFSRTHNSWQGNHAEVHALNEALWNRENFNQSQGNPRPVTEADLPSMTMQTAWTKSSQRGGMTTGEVAHRCANCTQLTDRVHNLAGDSTANYSTSKASNSGVQVATDVPTHAYANNDLSSARRGALTGGAAALGISTYQNLRDGVSVSDARAIATDTTLGVATGATGEMIENSVSRFVDAKYGATLQQGAGTTTRVLGSRVAGAGVAGAVIGAGFSSVDQIQAWQRGEVSGSEAIGTVTAEAATGLAAGATGAAAGAAIGSVIPVAGTAVGAVVGFGVGMAAGWAADKGLRAAGVTDAIADGVTSAIDAGNRTVDAVGDVVGAASSGVTDTVSGWGRSLSSAFGW